MKYIDSRRFMLQVRLNNSNTKLYSIEYAMKAMDRWPCLCKDFIHECLSKSSSTCLADFPEYSDKHELMKRSGSISNDVYRVCELGLEFAAWDSIWRVTRVRVRIRVWVKLTLTQTLNPFTRNKSNPKLQTPSQLHRLMFIDIMELFSIQNW